MYDQRLTLRATGSITDRRDIDLQAVRERLLDTISPYHPQVDDYLGGILIKVGDNDHLLLREFNPEQALREELVSNNDDEKELVMQDPRELALQVPNELSEPSLSEYDPETHENNSETQLSEIKLRETRESLRREEEVLMIEKLKLDEELRRLNEEEERLNEG